MASQEYIMKIKKLIDPKGKMAEEEVTRIAETLLKFYKIIFKIMESEDYKKAEKPSK